jgi:hypothetical protein
MTNPQIKACVDCRYCEEEMDFKVCTHPELVVEETNYVHGTTSTTALLCRDLRKPSEWNCGPEGKYWKPKPIPEVAQDPEFSGPLGGMIKWFLGL